LQSVKTPFPVRDIIYSLFTGATIGTGLFIASGTALANAGPVGALIAYIFIGSIVFSVMTSLGEFTTYIPVPGAFTSYATRLVDPSLGFDMGWIY
jgi:amino acid transporter